MQKSVRKLRLVDIVRRVDGGTACCNFLLDACGELFLAAPAQIGTSPKPLMGTGKILVDRIAHPGKARPAVLLVPTEDLTGYRMTWTYGLGMWIAHAYYDLHYIRVNLPSALHKGWPQTRGNCEIWAGRDAGEYLYDVLPAKRQSLHGEHIGTADGGTRHNRELFAIHYGCGQAS